MEINPLPYRWRGKVYKTVVGLQLAVTRAYPQGRFWFDRDAMVVRWKDGQRRFPRTITADACIIEDNDPAIAGTRRTA